MRDERTHRRAPRPPSCAVHGADAQDVGGQGVQALHAVRARLRQRGQRSAGLPLQRRVAQWHEERVVRHRCEHSGGGGDRAGGWRVCAGRRRARHLLRQRESQLQLVGSDGRAFRLPRTPRDLERVRRGMLQRCPGRRLGRRRWTHAPTGGSRSERRARGTAGDTYGGSRTPRPWTRRSTPRHCAHGSALGSAPRASGPADESGGCPPHRPAAATPQAPHAGRAARNRAQRAAATRAAPLHPPRIAGRRGTPR